MSAGAVGVDFCSGSALQMTELGSSRVDSENIICTTSSSCLITVEIGIFTSAETDARGAERSPPLWELVGPAIRGKMASLCTAGGRASRAWLEIRYARVRPSFVVTIDLIPRNVGRLQTGSCLAASSTANIPFFTDSRRNRGGSKTNGTGGGHPGDVCLLE